MTFTEFLNAILSTFNPVFNFIANFTNEIISNNFIKLIIYTALFSFIIYLFLELFNILYTILNFKHDKKETIKMLNPEEESNKKKKNKTGDNIKAKDIYW